MFTTDDKILDFICNICIYLIVYATGVGEKHKFFIRYKFVKNAKIGNKSLSSNIANSLDPFDYHVLKCGENAFTELDY